MLPAQKKIAPLILVGAFFLLSNRKKLKNKKHIETELKITAANSINQAGVIIQGGKIKVTDWNTWMRVGPHLIKTALKEGNESPEEVTNNVMRRLFPHQSWPPMENDPFFKTWLSMVVIVGRAINNPAQPHFEIVS